MHLKKIEISGFKSFADRTVITFDKGLTAVVGPNGSGKSNITEAVRWVLGEQSAKNLRGGKMPDIIFAGSEDRKPLNIAEVTVVLDNEERFLPLDFSEVSVTRRLNRKGDSDFFINKQSCRLKDIVDLFMDSGLGKESFSIISQGKVEAIFNSKPEDRRGIFEEAAGVLKYKQKKHQAEQKLFETEDNLNRLQDIIFELEGQIEPLAEQSKVAQEFLTLKERLTAVDVGVTVATIRKYRQVWQEKTEEVEALMSLISQLEVKRQQSEADLTVLRGKRSEVLKSMDLQQQELLKVTELFEQAEGQRHLLEERKKHSSTSWEKYEADRLETKEQIQQVTEEVANLKKEEATLQSEYQLAEEALEEMNQQLARFNKSTKELLEDLRSEYVEVMQRQANVSNDLKHLEKQYQQETAKNQQALTRFEKLQTKEKQLSIDLAEIENKWQEKQQEITGKQKKYQEVSAEQKQLAQEIVSKEKQMFDAMGMLQQAKARRNSLQELQENHAGFYQGVRGVLQAKKELSGIVGAVAELITVPTRYALAMETALGAAAQNVVVADEASGRKAIEYLKMKRLGRATFLPLTVIKTRSVPQDIQKSLQNTQGFLGIASELVSFSSSVGNIIGNLLGTTLIAENLNAANQLAKQVHYKFRVVSLDGDIMNPGGSMTGGATKKGQQGNLFTQANELEKLNAELQGMEETLKTLENHVRQLKANSEIGLQKVETIRSEGEALRLEEQDLRNHLENLKKDQKQVTDEQKVFAYETEEVRQFLESFQEEETKLKEKQAELQKKRDDLDQEIQVADASENERAQQKEAAQLTYNEQQGKIAVLLERLNHSQGRISEKETQQDALELSLKNLESQMALQEADASTHQETQESLEKRLEMLTSQKNQLQLAIEEGKQERESLQTSISSLDQALSELNQNQQAKLNEKNQSDVLRSKAEVTLDNNLNYLQETYHLTFEAAEKVHILEVEVSEAAKEVAQLKRNIAALGAVNTAAIEQYEEVRERYEFLVGQRDDLLTAKNSLFATMNEMDEEVKARFSKVFYAIRKEFQQVFPKMFGGGQADLRLTDPDDLLLTGIEIVAQPPGKKLQSLSLLSGGERALTAIALLFSIIQVRPVPFCILDEVEAALDEANVARFGRYLAQFENDTQFIVVTHRKGTMEAANVLYGVTMQESGVSKIVSVRLEDVNDRGDIQIPTA